MAVLHGNNFNNTIWAPAGNNTIYGWGGNDVLGGHYASDVIYGGDGNDTIFAGDDFAADTMFGGTGNDEYWVNGPEDVIVEQAGEGIDTVIAKFSWRLGANLENVTLQEKGASTNGYAIGNELSNSLIGNSGHNVFDGRAGNDTILGLAGDDTVYAGNGDDVVSGGLGNDVLHGDNGSDSIAGDSGNDTIFAGDDSVSDTLNGGAGDDVFWVNGQEDRVVEAAGQGIDTVIAKFRWSLLGGNVENVTLQEVGASANGEIFGNGSNNVLTGNGGANRIEGDAGDDTLIGGGGNDYMLGGEGNDRLYGGDGDDQIIFATGHDIATGGAGRDYFRAHIIHDPDNLFTITDFKLGEDRLYKSDTYRLGMESLNGGRDALLTYTDWHDPSHLPQIRVVLEGVTVSDIQDFLQGGRRYEEMFASPMDIPQW